MSTLATIFPVSVLFRRGNRWQEASAAFPTLRMAQAFITTECHLFDSGLVICLKSNTAVFWPNTLTEVLLNSGQSHGQQPQKLAAFSSTVLLGLFGFLKNFY